MKDFCVGETLWELPAGTLEPDELPIETAKRELIEESGYKANSSNPFSSLSKPGYLHRKNVCFCCQKFGTCRSKFGRFRKNHCGNPFVGQNHDYAQKWHHP